ncbi:TPA: phage virion morphogenesis protein [Klebsiella pneumoniae]|uniref:phage virion morphogenesis protein n=1 Tax=Klebsiella pneumoniae TaxID=573 RepID=UPI00115770A1|nr:phage virion morphogenesis protein [Klebsiella pneumoniae]HBQ8403835.1 phage virion morphogenesis protein [Klebsiella pneumoniae]HBR2415223.1 phage virion morphogenesis protein [Klebsiella pneumoniae]
MAYEIVFDVTDFERSLGELIRSVENRAPLMRVLAGLMEDSVQENFEQQGRPKWQHWKSNAYWAQRRGGKILQRSGRLAASITAYSDNDMATVGTNVVYAGIHQSGGKINIPARSQQAYYRQNKDGTLNNQFARKSKANYSEWHTIPAYEINMPARPFLRLTESDISDMEDKVADYFSQIYR